VAANEKILIAAPTAVERAGLAALLGADGELTRAVARRERSEALVDHVERERPDVVLVALERDDAPLARLLEGESGVVPVVAIVGELEGVAEALGSGLRGLLPRDASAAEILAAIRGALAGLVVVHPEIVAALARPAETVVPSVDANGALSPREGEVLRMLAEGLGNKEIAWQLGISEHTVKFHVASIFAKLGVSSRTEAVTIAIRRGLLLV
jgi:DNA-binding NarL/FixJ family response regulator